MIRILLADDHDLVREGIRRLLQDEPDFEIVGEAADSAGLLRLAADTAPHVAVLDISMPGPGILHLLRELHAAAPGCRAVVLSMHAEEEYALPVIRAGAAAYLTKDTSPAHLAGAVRRAREGGTYVTTGVGELLAAELTRPSTADPLSALSDREREVLRLLGSGQSTKRIAALLQLSPKTVSTYRARLMEKLALHSTADLIRFTITHGLSD